MILCSFPNLWGSYKFGLCIQGCWFKASHVQVLQKLVEISADRGFHKLKFVGREELIFQPMVEIVKINFHAWIAAYPQS